MQTLVDFFFFLLYYKIQIYIYNYQKYNIKEDLKFCKKKNLADFDY